MKKSLADAQKELELHSLIESHWAYQGKKIQLRLDTCHIKGKAKTFEFIHHPGAVAMIPIDREGNLILVRQWRRAISQIIIEIPAGTLEENEDPLQCAQRELQEEIGYRAENMHKIGGFFPTPGFCDEYIHLFVAKDLAPSVLPPDDDEGIDVVTVKPTDALRWIEEGRIQDAKSIAGILLWKNHEKI